MSRFREITRRPSRMTDPRFSAVTGFQDTKLLVTPGSEVWLEAQRADHQLQQTRDGWIVDADFVGMGEYAQRIGDPLALAIATAGLAILSRHSKAGLAEPA